MKASKKILAALLAVIMLIFAVSCSPAEIPEAPVVPDEGDTVYNVIFALATVPPVLAALDCIENGYDTYAIIERGKTYNGIDKLEYFHNAGFDPANNLSTGFTNAEFDAMVQKVKELKGEGVFFNFYVQDGTALRGAAIAANAGLSLDSFRIFMCEDGSGAYTALRTSYVEGKTVNAFSDEVYDGYFAAVADAKREFMNVMAKNDNQNGDAALAYNIAKAFALAALPNFVYCIQDKSAVADALDTGDTKTKLLSCFGIGEESDEKCSVNLKYQKISEGIGRLTEEQKADYLTLMYGDYFAETFSALTRTERADKIAPEKKLVFIGSRHSGYPKLASNAKYGIGGIEGAVPDSYEELDDKYKCEFLFAEAGDYDVFLSVLNDVGNYGEQITEEAKNAAQVACFNIYIDYIFTLKFTYALYGEDYDLIMKGHPREAIGCYGEWGGRYKAKYGEGGAEEYVYDKLLDAALLAFHSEDSVGKYIGTVPYGTAAENLAYLGADIAICGLPSSTYSGYDTDVDVLFILAETDEDISGEASLVEERYKAGNLTFTDKDGNEQTCVYFNIGNVFKYSMDICGGGNYSSLYESWLNSARGGADDIDAQGFAKQ